MSPSRRDIAAIRLGFGLHPTEVATADTGALLDGLRRAATMPVSYGRHSLADTIIWERERREMANSGMIRQELGVLPRARTMLIEEQTRRLLQNATGNGFFERLVNYWANHFTVSVRRPPLWLMAPLFEVQAIRPHVAGRFDAMLLAVAQHPAMLDYLDQNQSIGPNSLAGRRRSKGLNENFARELLELHLLGTDGGYTQQDVTELARLLTGFTFDTETGQFVFNPRFAEPGAKRVMGRVYTGEGPQAALQCLTDLSRLPQAATHICTRLARHFIADDPSARSIAKLADSFRRHDGQLLAVYETLLGLDETWARFGEKVKTPIDLVVSLLRTQAVPTEMTNPQSKINSWQVAALNNLSQPLWQAPGPDGWPEEAGHWITAQGLTARVTLASNMGRMLARSTAEPLAFAEMALGSALDADLGFVIKNAPERWQGFSALIASPAFNRR